MMLIQRLFASALWIPSESEIEYADGGDALSSGLEFLGILLGCFFVAGIILIGVMIFRNRKLRRLTNPVKEHTYKHINKH